MEISNERYRDLADGGHFYGSGEYAPVALIRSLLTLVGDGDITASTISRKTAGDSTTWRALWLTKSLVAWVEATGNKYDWTGHNEDPSSYDGSMPTEIEVKSWVCRVSTLASISTVDLQDKRSQGFRTETNVRWLATTRLEFDDGHSATLPLFGDTSSKDAETAEAVLAQLRAAWVQA